jgi:hypothetical protein
MIEEEKIFGFSFHSFQNRGSRRQHKGGGGFGEFVGMGGGVGLCFSRGLGGLPVLGKGPNAGVCGREGGREGGLRFVFRCMVLLLFILGWRVNYSRVGWRADDDAYHTLRLQNTCEPLNMGFS